MKNHVLFLLACIMLFASCHRDDNDSALAIDLTKIPETTIAEGMLGAAHYTHDELLGATADGHYIESAIYDCYREGGEVFYVLNSREEAPNNVNQRIGMDGLSTHYIQFYDGYYSSTGGMPDYKTSLRDYTFDEKAQTLNGLFTYHSTANVPHRLVYLSSDHMILEMDAPWKRLSAERGATFSRVVYTRVDEPTHPVVPDTVDYRK